MAAWSKFCTTCTKIREFIYWKMAASTREAYKAFAASDKSSVEEAELELDRGR